MTIEQEGWNDCPEGKIHEMVAGIRWTRRQRKLRHVATVLSLVLVIGMTAYVATRKPARSTEITCRQVQQLFADYEEKRLSAVQSEQIAAHLGACPHCRKLYGERRQESRRVAIHVHVVAMQLP